MTKWAREQLSQCVPNLFVRPPSSALRTGFDKLRANGLGTRTLLREG